jgi:hypothetical protein
LYGFKTSIPTLREDKVESVRERCGKENNRNEGGGEQDAVENCARRSFKKRY